MLTDQKILVTGPTSQVALPLTRALAQHNQVSGLARFSNPAERERLEALGVRCLAADLAQDTLENVPDEFDYVLHYAVVKSGDIDVDLAANVEGLGRLMSRVRSAGAFLHCSSGGVYQPPPRGVAVKETDPLGDNHRAMMPTYSLCKIAAEAMARFGARQWNLPTTIVRYSVPYGDNGGWPWWHLMMMKAGAPIPVHTEQPNLYNPLHEDDYIEHVPKLLKAATVPATTVNWGGSEAVSIEDWTAYLGELTGLEPKLEPTEQAFGSLQLDLTRMHGLLGPTRVRWRDGIRRMVKARNPELLS